MPDIVMSEADPSMIDLTATFGVKNVNSDRDSFPGEGVENLFDGAEGTKYCWPQSDLTTITFEFSGAVTPTHYAMMTANDTADFTTRNPKEWTISGSADGSSWTVLAKVTNGRELLTPTNFTWHTFALDTTGAFSHFKIEIVNDDTVQFSEIALLSSSDAAVKTAAELTDLTASVGVKNVRSNVESFPGEGVENLFDGNEGTKYCWPQSDLTTITFETNKAISPTHYSMMTANDTADYSTRNPKQWTIYGSADGSSWTVLAKVTNGRDLLTPTNFTWHTFALDQTGSFSYFKIEIVNDDTVQFSEIALLG